MGPIVLCILDGVGMRDETYGNAVAQAFKPNFDMLLKEYPHSLLEASGELVGLPSGQMGNSEVGHQNIGTGRIVYQPLQLINKEVKNNNLLKNKEILDVMNFTKKNNSSLHIFGLLSDGGIHSHINHLIALIDMCEKQNIKKVYFHMFLDGRDTKPMIAKKYLDCLQENINRYGFGSIATVCGRYYAMDRDNRWDRVKKAYDAIVNNKGEHFNTYDEVIEANYSLARGDEFVLPAILDEKGMVKDNDGLLLFNFRPDRVRELFSALTNPKFEGFERRQLNNIKLVTMMPVSDEVISKPAFKMDLLENTLGEYISKKGLKQLRIAETEKYAHVTYFFDGGIEKELKGCKRVLIPSPKVATYDLKPEMSAYEITDTLLKELDNRYDVVILNYANGDMVGHTGDMKATIKAVEVLDECLGKLYEKVQSKHGILLVTADHGNSDLMLDKGGAIITTHSTSKVPFVVTDKSVTLNDGKLGDIAPTILELLGIKPPIEMTGISLLKKVDREIKPFQAQKSKEETVKKKSKKKLIFIIISLILLLSLTSIYTYRLIHYYKLENPKTEQVKTFSKTIISNSDITLSGDGLYNENEEYIFKGNIKNNYVYYSGRLWRILRIYKDGSIKLITEDNQTNLVWGYQTLDYEESYIRDWLVKTDANNTGIFYNSLNNPDNYIIDYEYCFGEVTSKENMKCTNTIKDKVSLLTLEEYEEALGSKSFLNNNTNWWTINGYKDNKIWSINSEGKATFESNSSTSYYHFGVRPVITLKKDLIAVSGTGTEGDPYKIENETESALNNKSIGEYITFDEKLYRILNKSEEGIKLVYDGVLDNSSIYNYRATQFSSINTTIGKYLNITYYYTLKQKEKLVNCTFDVGNYDSSSYDYKSIYEKNTSAKIGLLSISNLFLTDQKNYTLVNLDDSNTKKVYTISEEGMIYTNDITSKQNLRPVICVNKDLTISSGNGTKTSPYVLN